MSKKEWNYNYYKADTQILKYIQGTAKNAYQNISKVKKKAQTSVQLKVPDPLQEFKVSFWSGSWWLIV